MPICSNTKFDWSSLEHKSPGASIPLDEATSPSIAAIIRDIETLYLMFGTPTDGQTGSPENAWQDNPENGKLPTGTTTTSTTTSTTTIISGGISAPNGTYGSSTLTPVITVINGDIPTITTTTISPTVAVSAYEGSFGYVSAGESISIPTIVISEGKLHRVYETTINAVNLIVCDGSGGTKLLTVYGTLI